MWGCEAWVDSSAVHGISYITLNPIKQTFLHFLSALFHFAGNGALKAWTFIFSPLWSEHFSYTCSVKVLNLFTWNVVYWCIVHVLNPNLSPLPKILPLCQSPSEFHWIDIQKDWIKTFRSFKCRSSMHYALIVKQLNYLFGLFVFL